MQLPNEIKKLSLGESSILYGNGLEIENVSYEENENGKFI